MGVDFFFVLSGFLITALLLREEDRNGSFSLRGFYWRRFLRIVPVYFLVVTALGLYFIGIKGKIEFIEILPFYYVFLSNFLVTDIPMLEPTWSLAVEEQYYLVWPLLLLLVPRRFILHVLVGLISLNVVAVTGGLSFFGITPIVFELLVIKMFTATYAPILIGSGLAIILHSKIGFETLRQVLGYRKSAPVLFTFLLVLLIFGPSDGTGWPNLLIHFTMASCLACIVIREDHALHSILTFQPIVRIGVVSYGIYLYHLIGLHITTVVLTKIGLYGDWYITGLYIFVAIGIAELSFRYYETPFLNLRHRNTYRKRSKIE